MFFIFRSRSNKPVFNHKYQCSTTFCTKSLYLAHEDSIMKSDDRSVKKQIYNCRTKNLKVLFSSLPDIVSEKVSTLKLKFVHYVAGTPIKRRKRQHNEIDQNLIISRDLQCTRSTTGCQNCLQLEERNRELIERNLVLESQSIQDEKTIQKLERYLDRVPIITEEPFRDEEIDKIMDPTLQKGCIKTYSPKLVTLALHWLADVCISARSIPVILQSFKDLGLWQECDIPSESWFRELRDAFFYLNLKQSIKFVEESEFLVLFMDETPTLRGQCVYCLGFSNQNCEKVIFSAFRFEAKADTEKKSEKVMRKVVAQMKHCFGTYYEAVVQKIACVSSDSSPEQSSTNKFILEEFEKVSPVVPQRKAYGCSQHSSYAAERSIISSQPQVLRKVLDKISSVAGSRKNAGYQPDSIEKLWRREIKKITDSNEEFREVYHGGVLKRKHGIRNVFFICCFPIIMH